MHDRIFAVPGFVEDDGAHREFVDGDHGLKLDWGVILPGMPEYNDAVDAAAEHILGYDIPPNYILSVANGTTDITFSVVESMREREPSNRTTILVTHKLPTREVAFTERTQYVLEDDNVDFLLILEDVATKGSTSAKLATRALSLGVRNVRVLNFVQRRAQLERLDAAGVEHDSLMHDYSLPTYTPEECNTLTEGYCNKGMQLIPHGS